MSHPVFLILVQLFTTLLQFNFLIIKIRWENHSIKINKCNHWIKNYYYINSDWTTKIEYFMDNNLNDFFFFVSNYFIFSNIQTLYIYVWIWWNLNTNLVILICKPISCIYIEFQASLNCRECIDTILLN